MSKAPDWKTLYHGIVRLNGLGYLRVDSSSHQFIRAADEYLRDRWSHHAAMLPRGAVDAALIFGSEAELDESLYWIIGNSYLRIVVISPDAKQTLDQALQKLATMRPTPRFADPLI